MKQREPETGTGTIAQTEESERIFTDRGESPPIDAPPCFFRAKRRGREKGRKEKRKKIYKLTFSRDPKEHAKSVIRGLFLSVSERGRIRGRREE